MGADDRLGPDFASKCAADEKVCQPASAQSLIDDTLIGIKNSIFSKGGMMKKLSLLVLLCIFISCTANQTQIWEM
jgi:hypothetical protein